MDDINICYCMFPSVTSLNKGWDLGSWNSYFIYIHFGTPEHFTSFNIPTPVVPVFTLDCSLLPLKLPSPPFPEKPLHLYSTAAWLAQPILLHHNPEEETPSIPLASPGWRIMKTHLICCWSWPDLHTHTVCLILEKREREREDTRILVTELQQTEGEKKASWKAVIVGGRRGGG